jgi:hypothetical protein
VGVELPFRLRGVDGVVGVSLTRNEEPERWGWRLLGLDVPLEHMVGFPVIEARVDFPAEGLGMPYVAFGVRPTYFDSPAISAPDADWRAATFLRSSPDVLLSRVIEPVCGFRWGYRRVGGETELVDAVPASDADWLAARDELVTRYPDWEWRSAWAS